MTKTDDRQVIRPTEAQLRWAQFHRKTRAQEVHEKLERLYQTPASPSDVPNALPDDGDSSSSSSCPEDETKKRRAREKPKISRGRRAMLRVSKRAYETRRLDIAEHGFQCDQEAEEQEEDEEDAVFAMFAEESVRKKHRKRRMTRFRAEDEEQRFRRFEAAYHAMMMNLMPQEQPELTPMKGRWTRASNIPVAVSIDGRQYDDLKWGFTGKRGTPVHHMATPNTAPFDRRASWLVHLPARQSSSRRLTFGPATSSDGHLLEPENGHLMYDDENGANFFSPGQMKFDELVARLQQRELELAATPHGQLEAQGKAAKFREKYSRKHSSEGKLEEDELPETDIYGFPCVDGSPGGQFSEAETEFWRQARNMHDTIPSGMEPDEFLAAYSTTAKKDYSPSAAAALGGEPNSSPLMSAVPSSIGGESEFWRQARHMHDTVPMESKDGMLRTKSGNREEHAPPATDLRNFRSSPVESAVPSEGESEFWRSARNMHDSLPDMVPGEHPYSALRRQLAAKGGHPSSVRTSDSETSPSDDSASMKALHPMAPYDEEPKDTTMRRRVHGMNGPASPVDQESPSSVPKLAHGKLAPFQERSDENLSPRSPPMVNLRSQAPDSLVKRRLEDMDGSPDPQSVSPKDIPKLSHARLEAFEEQDASPLPLDGSRGAQRTAGEDSLVKRRVHDMDNPMDSPSQDSPREGVPKLSQQRLEAFEEQDETKEDSMVKRLVEEMDSPSKRSKRNSPSVPKLSPEKLEAFKENGSPLKRDKAKLASPVSGSETAVRRRDQDINKPLDSPGQDSPSVPKISPKRLEAFESPPSNDAARDAESTSPATYSLQNSSEPSESPRRDSPLGGAHLPQERLEPFREGQDKSPMSADRGSEGMQTPGLSSSVNREIKVSDPELTAAVRRRRGEDTNKPLDSPNQDSPSIPKLSQKRLTAYESPPSNDPGRNTESRSPATDSLRWVQDLGEPSNSPRRDSPSDGARLSQERLEPFREGQDKSPMSVDRGNEALQTPGSSSSANREIGVSDPGLSADKSEQSRGIPDRSLLSPGSIEESPIGRQAGSVSVRSPESPADGSVGLTSQRSPTDKIPAVKMSKSEPDVHDQKPVTGHSETGTAARIIGAKVGGMFSGMFGGKKESDAEELRAVAAFRKTQDERRDLNDDGTSTSSFRILPEGIRRVVKNFGTSQRGMNVAIQSESSDAANDPTMIRSSDRFEPKVSPSRSGASRSSVEGLSPEHGKFIQQSILEDSALIGDEDVNATIIDTDGTTSDATGPTMDPQMAANLFLSPTILTKRLHQAMRAIERHNWEQLTYLLSANPWLAEMVDVTTGQYLLHKLALYGAGVAVIHPDAVDVVHVEAPAAPEELSLNLIRMFPSSVHKFDQDGNLPLHMAAVSGNLVMCRFLGERFPSGASVRNEEGLLPLHMAIQSCSSPAPSADGTITSPSEIVKAILGFFPGAVAVTDNDGNLPIHCAAAALHGELGEDIIYMLLDEADKQVEKGLMFRIIEAKTIENDDETIATDITAESSTADDYAYCNLVRNSMGHTPLMTAIRANAGWEIIEAIACGPGGRKAALVQDATMSNALHLLVSGKFADPASILSILKIAPQTASIRNSQGMLPIEIACMETMPREVILALVLVDLPIDLDEKAGIKVREGFGGSWCYLTCECDDHYLDVVEEVISICSYPQVRELCFAKCGPNENGGSVVTRATPSCRLALRKALRFVGRFEFLGSAALHSDASMGVKVFEALDFGTEEDDFEDGRRVLLRCYSREQSYLEETTIMRDFEFDTAFVEDLFAFGVQQDAESTDASPQQYCVAIELPSLTLDRVVGNMLESDEFHRNPDLRSRYFSKVCMVLRLIAKSLRHLHQVGVVHGDVRLENCGKFDDKWKLMSSLGMQPIGARFNSARMGESAPPEAVEMGHDVTFKDDIVAEPPMDMWAFGKLTFEVLTGEPLIRFDANKDTHHDHGSLLQLARWNKDDLRDVINHLKDCGVSTLGCDLVSHCLLPDPTERPSSMDEILEHPFWKDMRRNRTRSSSTRRSGLHEV